MTHLLMQFQAALFKVTDSALHSSCPTRAVIVHGRSYTGVTPNENEGFDTFMYQVTWSTVVVWCLDWLWPTYRNRIRKNIPIISVIRNICLSYHNAPVKGAVLTQGIKEKVGWLSKFNFIQFNLYSS
jgi:hypothetical protein